MSNQSFGRNGIVHLHLCHGSRRFQYPRAGMDDLFHGNGDGGLHYLSKGAEVQDLESVIENELASKVGDKIFFGNLC